MVDLISYRSAKTSPAASSGPAALLVPRVWLPSIVWRPPSVRTGPAGGGAVAALLVVSSPILRPHSGQKRASSATSTEQWGQVFMSLLRLPRSSALAELPAHGSASPVRRHRGEPRTGHRWRRRLAASAARQCVRHLIAARLLPAADPGRQRAALTGRRRGRRARRSVRTDRNGGARFPRSTGRRAVRLRPSRAGAHHSCLRAILNARDQAQAIRQA